MKAIIRATAIVAAFVIVGSIPGTSQTFGYSRGMTPQDAITLVGKEHIKKSEHTGLLTRLLVTTAPKPHNSFEEYSLLFSPSKGLLKITGIGITIETSSDGSELKSEYNKIRDQLIHVYSEPSNSLDAAKSGSIWREPEDFMMGLVKNDRYLSSIWTSKDNENWKGVSLPTGISSISIDANGLNSTSGYITVTYEFDGWGEFVQEIRNSESTAF